MDPDFCSDRYRGSEGDGELSGSESGAETKWRLSGFVIRGGRPVPTWMWVCLVLVASYAATSQVVAWVIDAPVRWPIEDFLIRVGNVILLAYGLLVAAYVADEALGGRVNASHLRVRLFSAGFLFELVVAIIAVHMTWMVFVTFRHYVPVLNPSLHDSPLWRLDAWLHFGMEPGVVTSELAARHGLLGFFDRAYFVFLALQILVPLLFLLSRRLQSRRGLFFAAYACLCVAGSLLYVLWPSLGPAYYWPSRFQWLEQASQAHDLQGILLQDYLRFRLQGAYDPVEPYYGVAAFPSLEVGMLTLFSLATWRWRALSIFLWAVTVVTFIASLALGWHYAVDGYAGAFLACATWWIGTKLEARAAARKLADAAVAAQAPPRLGRDS